MDKEQTTTLQLFQQKLNGELKIFPQSFFQFLTQEDLKEMMRYFIEDFLQWDEKKICNEFNTIIFIRYGLRTVLNNFFEGDPKLVLDLVYPGKYQYQDLRSLSTQKKKEQISKSEILNAKLQGNLKSFPDGFLDSLTEQEKVEFIRFFIEKVLNWTPEEAIKRLDFAICKEYKIYSFIYQEMGGIHNALMLAYPQKRCNIARKNPHPVKGAQENVSLIIFKEKLEGKRETFPKGFYQSLTEEDKIMLMQYFVEDFLKLTPQKVSVATFKKYGLYNFIREVYGSVKKAFALTYPEKF